MGCDIHHKYQYKDREGIWHNAKGAYRGDRNYDTFGALAGVRNPDMPLIHEPRGLPDGVENVDWEFGEHSFSWATLDEITQFWDDFKRTLINTEIAIIMYDMQNIHRDQTMWGRSASVRTHFPDVRIVYGFDS
jgi:hypothetical protein